MPVVSRLTVPFTYVVSTRTLGERVKVVSPRVIGVFGRIVSLGIAGPRGIVVSRVYDESTRRVVSGVGGIDSRADAGGIAPFTSFAGSLGAMCGRGLGAGSSDARAARAAESAATESFRGGVAVAVGSVSRGFASGGPFRG